LATRSRKPRKRVTLDESGQTLAGVGDVFSTAEPDFPVQLTSDPDINKQVVPAGTPAPSYVTGIALNFPPGYDSWYFPTSAAVMQGKAQAAIDTVIATGDQVGAAIQKVADVGGNIMQNIVPILIGIAAILLLLRMPSKG